MVPKSTSSVQNPIADHKVYKISSLGIICPGPLTLPPSETDTSLSPQLHSEISSLWVSVAIHPVWVGMGAGSGSDVPRLVLPRRAQGHILSPLLSLPANLWPAGDSAGSRWDAVVWKC